jgi:hypothetical protein
MGGQLPSVDLGTLGSGASPTAGSDGSCALRSDGVVVCWGSGQDGLPGQGDTADRGDEPGEMGSALAGVPLGSASAVETLHVARHACVLLAGGSVRCWGRNDHGQLGCGDTDARGDEPGEMGTSLLDVDLGGSVRRLFGTARGGCVELVSDAVKCWGDNSHGALGLGDTDDRGDEPNEMGVHLPAVPLGARAGLAKIVGGAQHHCALFADGGVACWGSGEFGQHGLETTDDRGDEPNEMGDALPLVRIGH